MRPSAPRRSRIGPPGDPVADIPNANLCPLLAEATVGWAPESGVEGGALVVGGEATYTAAVALGTASIPVLEGAEVPGTAAAATDFLQGIPRLIPPLY